MSLTHRSVVLLLIACILSGCGGGGGTSSRDSGNSLLATGPSVPPAQISSTTSSKLAVVVDYPAGQKSANANRIVSLRVSVIDLTSGQPVVAPVTALRPTDAASQTVDVEGIPPGLWQVVVTGLDGNGQIMGFASRAAQIADGLTTTITITSFSSVSGLAVTPTRVTLAAGTTQPFVATANLADGTTANMTSQATWSSADPAIASVSNQTGSAGVASALTPGTTRIVASLAGQSAEAALTVSGSTLTSLSVTPTTANLSVGGSLGFRATATFSDGSQQDVSQSVSWTSSDPGVATISSAGAALAVAPGITRIGASFSGQTASASLTVTTATLQSLVISGQGALAPGTSTPFTASGTFSDGSQREVTAQVTWTSSNPAVATVTAQGQVTAVAAGQTSITASLNGVAASLAVTVSAARIVSITVTPASLTVTVGAQRQYTAQAQFSDGTSGNVTQTVTWSSNGAAATISNANGTRGIATATAVGNTTIIATDSATQVSGSTSLTVIPAPFAGFNSPLKFGGGFQPRKVVIGDINGDGRPDAVEADTMGLQAVVFLNTTQAGGRPSFADSVGFNMGSAAQPNDIALADLDGDGRPDLIAANFHSTITYRLNTTPNGAATPTFAPPVILASFGNIFSVTTADFNKDGKMDVAIGNGSSIIVLLNTTSSPGAPTFSGPLTLPVPVGNMPYIDAADIDGDGKPDLITPDFNSNQIYVLQNTTPTGGAFASFNAPLAFTTGNKPEFSTTADIDGDGKLDLVTADSASNTTSVLVNTTPSAGSAPSFATAVAFSVGTQPFSVAAGDLNGDGKPDLVTANFSGGLSVLLNTSTAGTPSFNSALSLEANNLTTSATFSDIDGDGRLDIIAAMTGTRSIGVYLNATPPGGQTFDLPSTTSFFADSQSIAVVSTDFNGDGKKDLAVANLLGGDVSVLLNTTLANASKPAFAPALNVPVTTRPDALAFGDMNGDGRLDLLTTDNTANQLAVVLNTTPTGSLVPSFGNLQTFLIPTAGRGVATADINGDGKPDAIVVEGTNVQVLLNSTPTNATVVTFQPRVGFPAGTGPSAVCCADVNRDGKPDVVVAQGGAVRVLLNTTPGGAAVPTFAAAVSFSMNSSVGGIATGDLNGDGAPDVVIGGGSVVTVFINTTPAGANTPSFATATDIPTGVGGVGNAAGVAVADMTGDGVPDILFADRGISGVGILINSTATGSTVPQLAPAGVYAAGLQPISLTVDDFNGDGKPDAATALFGSFNSPGVSVLLAR